MVNAQKWLESQTEYNTKEKRAKIIGLKISDKNLEGSLNLTDFVNLTTLYCSDNKLTNINFLSSVTHPQKLIILGINNNKFLQQDLTFLIPFVNLEEISLENNNFTGSLQPLSSLTKLETLNINNTDLNSGLEYIPESLERIYCAGTKLAEELKDYYDKRTGTYDLLEWRFNNLEIVELMKENNKFELAKKFLRTQKQLWDLQYGGSQSIRSLEKGKQRVLEDKEQSEWEREIYQQTLDQERDNWEEQKANFQAQFVSIQEKALEEISQLEEEVLTVTSELEREITEIKTQIKLKEEELKSSSINKEQLEKEKINLEIQLTQKERKVIELEEENTKLLNQVFLYQELNETVERKKWELQNIKKEISEKGYSDEIGQRLCQKQAEVTQAEIKLEEAKKNKDKTIINIVSSVKADKGNIFIGNEIGDSANFSYHNQITELSEQITQMEVNPYQNN